MTKTSSIFVAGHRGLAGSAILRALRRDGFTRIVTQSRTELDLTDRESVMRFFKRVQPEYVFGAAAKVGGIMANKTYPADFIRENLLIQTNLMDACLRYGVVKQLMLGSSCIYPKMAPQPIKEDYLLTGALEPTNDAYAIAKIAGIVMARSYRTQYGLNTICLMPTNLYGPGDNFDPENSHVLPALLRKFHEAAANGTPAVTLWGTGTPRREFMHVDDLAEASVYLMNHYDEAGIVNVGTGIDLSIRELAEIIAAVTGFRGEIHFDSSKPDGTPRKLLDVSLLHSLGWTARRDLREGIVDTYKWYRSQASVELPSAASANAAMRLPQNVPAQANRFI